MEDGAAHPAVHARTHSLCATCRCLVEASVVFDEGGVFLEKECPAHGRQRSLLASSVDWYVDALSFSVQPRTPARRDEVHAGCPFDCGPCTEHRQQLVMPVVPITSACNLDCAICYTINRGVDPHMLGEAGFASILQRLRERSPDLDIINFTGGEPTLHPSLPRMLRMSREAGIRRLTVSTNGLELVSEDTVRELAAADARVVISLDTLDNEVDQALLGARTVGAKREALALLERHDVTTTLLPAVAARHNDVSLGPLFDLMLATPNICSLEVHTLCFTGQGGLAFDRAGRITVPDVHRLLEQHTAGRIAASDFVPSPLAHPCCYSICYLLLLDGGGYVPYARLIGRQRLFDLLGRSLYIQPGPEVEVALRAAMEELWLDPDRLPESERVLKTLRRLLLEMFPHDRTLSPPERLRVAERAAKAVYVHSHMDEETFDLERLKLCGICVPEEDGSLVPTCAYNVLYRESDPRFADPARLARMGRTPHPLMDRARARYARLARPAE